MYPPDGLLTTGLFKHDVDIEPVIIAPDPYESDNYLDDSPPDYYPSLLTTTDKIDTMNTGEDEPASGLNGRLRPRKSTVPSIQNKTLRKSDGKSSLDRAKRTGSPTKASPNKPDDLSLNKSETTQQQLLCPYCDRKFAYKQTVSKHARRVHLPASKQDSFIGCLFCNHNEAEPNEIIRHMVDSHPNQYFACLDCHTRFPSTSELAEHKLNVCEKQKPSYRSKLRQKSSTGPRKNQKKLNIDRKDEYRNNDGKDYAGRHGFNGIVISCELKPAQVHDEADIEDNITTNLILPPSKNLGNNTVLEKNAVIVLDDIQWNKRMPPNFTFHNTDADQILSRLGVVHRSPRTGESTRRDWFKSIDETTQKFEKCFDTSFYSKVASNVQENLAKFLDGSFNFNPDPDNTIKTRKSKNSVVINTAEGFPILLAYEQYSRNVFDGYMPRAIAPKHKWKWDNLENDKNIMNPDQIKRDSHANDCIITLVSSLDIWTQLCMKRKFEEKFSCSPLQKKTERQNIIGRELKEILESREIPTSSSQLVKYTRSTAAGNSLEFPALLGLTPAMPQYEVQPAVLSGEWVRPRCYVCCACGAQTRDSRGLSSHISTQHPNAQVQHYEIVGEMLLNADILKHLYVPPSQMSNRTRPMRGFRECTKCKKPVSLEDLHQHMLDCAGDTPTVRRKCRYRPFGVRRRRPRLPDNTIRKKIRKDIQTRQRQKGHIRSRPRIRTEVGDAETIRKMIADLPAKRHRVMVNPMNSNIRPRRNKQRTHLIRKQRTSNDQRIRRPRIKDPKKSISIKETASELNQDKDPTNNDKDDDDNLPLKPRPKRIPRKASRQNEVFKRKAMLSRAKRKAQNQNITKAQDINPIDQSSNDQINVSRDNIPQRVDVNGGPVNAREHSGRGEPNNRGDQPGGSRQDNNPNNAHVPAQNAPLKHSIARLTADSETHDKSVQFHHLFLVQQECNNGTQHVPTGQQQLFENEAVVTRLDKPPLPYQKPQLDPTALQKSKLNKPRKGLNDCIAMLKNKLVDPIPPSIGQVSVQCGSDEPLDMDHIMIAPRPIPPESHIDLRPAEIYSRHSLPVAEKVEIKRIRSSRNRSATCQRSASLSIDTTPKEIIKLSLKKPSLTLEVIPPKQKQSTTPVKRKSNRLRSASCVSHEQNIQAQITSLSPRLDPAQVSHMAQALQLLQLPPSLQLSPVTQIPKGFNETLLTPFKISYMPKNVVDSRHTKTTRTRPRRESNKKTETGTNVATKQRAAEINVVVTQPTENKPLPPKTRSQSHIDTQPEHASNNIQLAGQRSPEIYIQATQPNQTTCSSYSDDRTLQSNPPELVSQQVSRRVSDDVYVESNFRDIPAGIPPAHSSTSIEFITPTPLDLSGKSLPINCPETRPKLDNTYTMHAYDTYETLDLSNKKSSDAVSLERETDIGVVDLRIKSSEQLQFLRHTRPLDMCEKLTNIIDSNGITDLSMRPREEEYIPTDLSMKRKNSMEFNQIPTEPLNYDVQNLSGHNMFMIDECKNCSRPIEIEKISLTEDIPTDLSGKNTQIISTPVSSQATESNMDITTKSSEDLTLKDVAEDTPADLSGKTPITVETSTDVQTAPIKDSLEQYESVEFSKCEEKNNFISNPSLIDPGSSVISKPVYDPTLKIPQYKIKTTVSTTGTETLTFNLNSDVVPHSPNLVGVTQIGTLLTTSFPTTTIRSTQNLYLETPTQEKLSFDFISSSMNVNTITGSIPIYTFPNPRPSIPASRFEITKPVYTLANACISVTKIETSNTAALTNTLLSIPGTTIASTTSVYTLAGTTVGAPINYGSIIPNVLPPIGQSTIKLISPVLAPAMGSILRLEDQNSSCKIDKDIENPRKVNNVPIGVEQDPETAKKIAMLPKELVEILGTMPAGHRNQLLNVLPQYVSTSTAGSGSTPQEVVTVQCVTSIENSSCEHSKLDSFVDTNKAFSLTENVKSTCIKMPSVSTTINDSTTNQSTSLTDIFKEDSKNTINISLDSCSSLQNQVKLQTGSEDVKPLMNDKISEDDNRPASLNTNTDIQPLNPTTAAPTNNVRINSITEPTIIDLTEDENPDLVPRNANLSEEVLQPIVQLQREEPPVETVKQKCSNKKTASLRAVRIKAPSERNKSNIIDLEVLSKNVGELPLTLNTSEQDDNEANKSLDSDTSLAIQQAEVSSTQHNKSSTTDRKSSASISPVDLESSNEELSGEQTIQTLPSSPEILIKTDTKSSNGPQASLQPTLSMSTDSKEHDVPVNEEEVNANLTPVIVNATPESCKALDETIVSHDVSIHDSSQVTDTCVIEPPIQNSKPIRNLMLEKELLNHRDDDDSDDDISLAIIVKQKKLDPQKYAMTEETLPPQNDKCSKKKEKKLKKADRKTIRSDESLRKQIPGEIPILDETQNNETMFDNAKRVSDDIDDCHSKTIEMYSNICDDISAKSVAIEGIQVKNKLRKFQNFNVPELTVDRSEKTYNTESYEIDLKKEYDTCFQSNKQKSANRKDTICEDIGTLTTEIVRDTKIPSEKLECQNISKAVTETQEEVICQNNLDIFSQNEQSTTNESETLAIKEREKMKKKHAVCKTLNEPINSHSNKLQSEETFTVSNILNTDHNKITIKDSVDKELGLVQEHSTQKEDSLIGTAEAILNGADGLDIAKNKYESCKSTFRKNDYAEASNVGNNVSLSTENGEKQSVVPLRRSRRGKSMFVENISGDNVVPPEVPLEQKAPLTKKQLIFSKLLLDEENQPDIHPNMASEKVLSFENETSVIDNSILDSDSQMNDPCISSNKFERRKSVKRKKSPQAKRKYKKNKLLHLADLEENADNSQSIVNNTVTSKFEEGIHSKQSDEKGKLSCMNCCDSQTTSDQLIKEISNTPVNEFKMKTCEKNENSALNDNDEDDLSKTIENTNIYNTMSSTTEKRKLSLPTVTADIGHLPKIKKTKLNKNENLVESESIHEEYKTIEDNSFKIKDKSNVITENRTACYNRPAARRTRSKSVFVKSSVNEFYDPYDIDLDEMIEKPEPFSNKMLSFDEKLVGNNVANLPHPVKSTFIKNSKRETKDVEFSKISKKEKNPLIRNNIDLELAPEDFNHISDSDDSTKSDVPLKKYMEDKEKKLQEQEERVVPAREIEDDFDLEHSEISDDKQIEKEDRKSRRTLAVFNNVDTVATSTTETEEQLRSEQFMESFGFFSERKPRKSNLLASKKISETFHIIANESEDMYYGVKDRSVKKSLQNENRKSMDDESNIKASQHSPLKKAAKRGRKKKSCTKIVPCYCGICKKEFRRSDNYLRHQMTLLHISKLSEIEMKVKTAPVLEEPNYLIVYKQHLDRLKILTDKLAKRKKNSKSAPKITLPTMEEIVAEVKKTVREQQLSQRGLSRDEALFLDCCELLKESHKNDLVNTDVKLTSDVNSYACGNQATISELDLITKRFNEDSTKSDGDVDSITAKNILESEEVRNLENDLISGLKEAANASNAKHIVFPRSIDDIMESHQQISQNFLSSDIHVNNFDEADEGFEHLEEPIPRKPKKHPEVKEKMYPDIIENIDMFEDKFDKIKRKCRSQAAAAKQAQTVVEATTSYKGRKKSEKKKGKRSSKKNHQSTQVLTKGALKGFDGIKVSIPTSDINMSAIVPSLEPSSKKKKKNSSKKKREKKDSLSSGKYDSDHRAKDSCTPQRKVDVYEFMDNEDAELFEFRPSTLMERFKSMSNKDTPSTSKFNPVTEDADMSSDSISDGDDFVYMSDDYVCSDDETENSLMSCELTVGKVNTEVKKTASPLKRKDVYEKNAVMGKIFKHNAVRSEKKSNKVKETVKPKTNLDQLFDSLLEEEPSSSMLNSDFTSPKNDDLMDSNKHSSYHYDSPPYSGMDDDKLYNKNKHSSSQRCGTLSSKDQELSGNRHFTSNNRYDDSTSDSGPLNSTCYGDVPETDYGPSTSKKHNILSRDQKSSLPRKHDSSTTKKYDYTSSKTNKSPKNRDKSPAEICDELSKKYEAKSPSKKLNEDAGTSYEQSGEQLEQYCYDEAGVARQRARRKCTVGKQNVLAETWSSESEPDGVPPRPNSAESVVMGGGRRRKGKKREGSQSGTRRGSSRHVIFRRQDVESRVTSSSRNTWSGGTRGSSGSRGSVNDAGEEEESLDASGVEPASPPPAPAPTASSSGSKARPRAAAYYWSSEGDEEQEHLQQHGWIVGDSHKKLVTMLAHAKGRKRNNDDKRHLVE